MIRFLMGLAALVLVASTARAEESGRRSLAIESGFVGQGLEVVIFGWPATGDDRVFFRTGPGQPLRQLHRTGATLGEEVVDGVSVHTYSIGFDRNGPRDGRLQLGVEGPLRLACGDREDLALAPMTDDYRAHLEKAIRAGDVELVPLGDFHRPVVLLQTRGSDVVTLVDQSHYTGAWRVFHGTPGSMKELTVTGGMSPRSRHEWWLELGTAEGVSVHVERSGHDAVGGEPARRLSKKRAVLRWLGITGVPDRRGTLTTPCDP